MSVPPDIMALLQGGGNNAGGSMPPDMLSALGGAPEESPQGGLHGGAASEGDPEVFYREALDALEEGMKADVDEARINTMMQCAAKIQGELANSQKGLDGMAGGKFDQATMRRMGAADQAY